MATELSGWLNPVDSDIGGGSWDLDRDLESLLFDELNDSSDVLEALKNPFDMDMEIDFSLEVSPWDDDPWGPTCNMSPGTQIMSEPQSPASSCSMTSSDSILQNEELLYTLSCQSSPVSPWSKTSDCSSPSRESKVTSSLEVKCEESVPVNVTSNISKQKPIQPKPILIPALSVSQSSPTLAGKTIIIHPVQNVVSVLKQQPVKICPVPSGQPIVIPQSAVVQLQPQSLPASQPVLNMAGGANRVSTAPLRVLTPANKSTMNGNAPVGKTANSTPAHAAPINRKPDVNALRRQERMIKNRESASLSRRKKKEYLLNLECRLRSALLENAKLKNENGFLQKQLQELMSENQQLKVTTPKRRAVCAMVLLAFIALSYGPASIWEKHSGALQSSGSPATHSRHLLGFSDENRAGSFQERTEKFTEENYRNGISISDKKDLMVVKKEPLLFVKRACHPQVNRTESLRLADELRGWVHRHEVVRVKMRKGSKMFHKIRTVSKSTDKKTDIAQYVTGMYTNIDKKDSGSELQVYYAPDERYPNFFEAIRRRGDTFYLISFRRDHLLLPAISHNKTTRPKMSLVLPAMKVGESFINDPKDHEVMMQIDCEVMATRIIHIKSSSIPSFLQEQRENHTNSYQRPSPAPTHAAPHIITETHGTGFKLYQ
ncbi:cyclic AMP-dependent transcription factor ATF-6 alpha [Chiloscyllium plagiosum]|uniref:cyclic AMP-dependent transcription factor ATF-6 alpha n=1 Tax=Chiloscyllium plagiosum TaxID=36176 RepID=UPI001CB82548|nr:cyclic AMP-dependent transcription factor ATF-6 alpha [Chiloscyllium plagiosum]